MIRDITYCVSHVCPMRQSCERARLPQNVAYASLTDFHQIGAMCSYYWPTSQAETEPAIRSSASIR